MENTRSPTLQDWSHGAFINTRLEEAVASEEVDQRLRAFAQSFEMQLQSYDMTLKRMGTHIKEKIDVQINELIFQLDGAVSKVRSDAEGSAKVWATAMEKIIVRLVEVPYSFPAGRGLPLTVARNATTEGDGTETSDVRAMDVGEEEADDINSPASVGHGDLPSLSREAHEAAVCKTWRRYLASTEMEAISSAASNADEPKQCAAMDLVATPLYARWEAAFALVGSFANTENHGQHVLSVMAYVDLLTATADQIQCFAAGAGRREDCEVAALRSAEGGAYRDELLQGTAENLLFVHQVWWWWSTKVQLVREKVDECDRVHDARARATDKAAAAVHEATVVKWRRALTDADEAADAVVAAALQDITTVAVAVLRHAIAQALADPCAETRSPVQLVCRVISRAVSFFLRALPDAFYKSPCGASTNCSTSAEAASGFLRHIIREALRPTAEDALEHAEEWFTAPTSSEEDRDGATVSPRRAALRAILELVEHYWGTELTRSDDIMQTLKRL